MKEPAIVYDMSNVGIVIILYALLLYLLFVVHTQVRSDLAIKGFCVVDTPGMIDSPVLQHEGMKGNQKGRNRLSLMDRGYDFEGVCRWYAERADVILLFFDPDKPGTTGETLSILTNSLVGQDYKLHIILNKADQFRKIHDFARAYGSLCWNLSKVIQRKDLPRIYTMCLPTSLQTRYICSLHVVRYHNCNCLKYIDGKMISNVGTRSGSDLHSYPHHICKE